MVRTSIQAAKQVTCTIKLARASLLLESRGGGTLGETLGTGVEGVRAEFPAISNHVSSRPDIDRKGARDLLLDLKET
jgi:hypothetical protein